MTDYGKKDLDILVICPHPDDAEITAGGTLIKAADAGLRTGVIDLTRGESGTRGTPETRLAEAEKASELLGLAVRENLGLRDSFVSADEETAKICASVIRKHRPQLVIAPHWEGIHPDHYTTAEVVRRAVWLAGLYKWDDGQAHWRPNAVIHHNSRRRIHPDFVVDITEVWERKVKAMLCHKSQFYNPDNTEPETRIASKGFLKVLEGMNRFYGGLIRVEFGEPFALRETLPVPEPWKLFKKSII